MRPGGATYREAGVDVGLGDEASRILFEASRLTWANRRGRIGEIEDVAASFGDVRFFRGLTAADAVLGMNFDGVGTKVEIAERTGRHDTLAHDLLAMVCDDAAIRGAEPVVVGSILDCNRLSVEVVRQLAAGMVEAARIARVAVINGEVAELGGRVQGYGEHAYNWGGAVVWVGRRDRIVTGDAIRAGDAIVAVREPGFRSNGISLARRVFAARYGDGWHARPFGAGTLGEAALAASIIYTPLMVALTGGYDGEARAVVSGMAHVTGGGIPGKLGRLLRRSGHGAVLDDLFEPGEVVRECQAAGAIPDAEAYRTWNMGQGLLIVAPAAEPVLEVAAAGGFEARVAGRITTAPVIEIASRGTETPGTVLACPVR
jgi:phosphoribosylformylglycinamidine cyclo-ligase